MNKQIICLDFDGVVHSYTSGWKGARNIPDPPVEGVFMFISLLLANGYDVVIHSSRARHFGGIWAMRRYVKHHAGNMWYDDIERVRFVRFKPPAIITIDDRALTFDGTWPALEVIRNFKPWNKREDQNPIPNDTQKEKRILARLAWNNWLDTPEARKIIAEQEAKDAISACAWDRVIEAIEKVHKDSD